MRRVILSINCEFMEERSNHREIVNNDESRYYQDKFFIEYPDFITKMSSFSSLTHLPPYQLGNPKTDSEMRERHIEWATLLYENEAEGTFFVLGIF